MPNMLKHTSKDEEKQIMETKARRKTDGQTDKKREKRRVPRQASNLKWHVLTVKLHRNIMFHFNELCIVS